MDKFPEYHPIVNFIYFFVLFVSSLGFQNPVIIAIILVSELLYFWILSDGKAVFDMLKIGAGLAVLSFVINPLFNHQGVTVLFTIKNNPVTAESIVYAAVIAGFLLSMLLLFACFQKVMTADKITVLFGKLSPRFALTFSMAVSFVPKLSRDYRNMKKALNGIGRKNKSDAISSLIGIGLEDSIERADSMAGRGYLLKNKKSHVLPPLTKRDIILVTEEIAMAVCIFFMAWKVPLKYEYFPIRMYPVFDEKQLCYYCLLGLFGLLPIILQAKEEWKWRRK